MYVVSVSQWHSLCQWRGRISELFKRQGYINWGVQVCSKKNWLVCCESFSGLNIENIVRKHIVKKVQYNEWYVMYYSHVKSFIYSHH